MDQEHYEEVVNQPPHYKIHSKECIDEMAVVFGPEAVRNFCVCNAWKYRYRAGSKAGADVADDMAKSDWYINKAEEIGLEIQASEYKKLYGTYCVPV